MGGVVLTRGKNTLKGDTLVYDFASGKSVLNGGASTTTKEGGKTRVRALFVPEKNGAKP
jgi:lipopolysaccharide export system protein LptA